MSVMHWKYINQIDAGTIYRYSSQVETLPAINVQLDILRKPWKTQSGFVVTQRNREFPFRNTATTSVTNFSIASGTYTGSGLVSVIASGLNANGIYTDHSGTYNSTTGKFTLQRPGATGSFDLMFGNTTYKANTVAVLLGFANGTNYTGTKTYSATSLGNEHELVVQFTSTQSVNCFIIDRHNFASGTVIRLRTTKSTASVFSGGWNANGAITKSSTVARVASRISIEFTATSVKSLQLYWYDRSQAYSQIGRVWAGTYFLPQYQGNSYATWEKKKLDFRQTPKYSQAGVTFFDKKNLVNEYKFGIDPFDVYYNPLTVSGFETMFSRVKNSQAFYVSMDENIATSTVYVYIANKSIDYTRVKNTPVYQVADLTLREQL